MDEKRICLNQSVLDFMAAKMKPDSFVIEYGSGWSTRWFADRCGYMVSVETDPRWFTKVQNDLQGVDCKLELRLTRQVGTACRDMADHCADLILIDCDEIHRHPATMNAWRLLKPGGWILFDDAQRKKHEVSVLWIGRVAGVATRLEWQPGDIETAMDRLTLAWQKPATTGE